jgi:hypothetical protein
LRIETLRVRLKRSGGLYVENPGQMLSRGERPDCA